MGLLTVEEQKRYALAHGKKFIASCDSPGCGALIPMGSLYVVVKSTPRTDGNSFLSATPTRIRCIACDNRKHPKREALRVKKIENKGTSVEKLIKRITSKIFAKHTDLHISTKSLISRLQKKQKLAKIKHREFTKAFRALKKEKVLVYKEKEWQLRKTKSVQ